MAGRRNTAGKGIQLLLLAAVVFLAPFLVRAAGVVPEAASPLRRQEETVPEAAVTEAAPSPSSVPAEPTATAPAGPTEIPFLARARALNDQQGQQTEPPQVQDAGTPPQSAAVQSPPPTAAPIPTETAAVTALLTLGDAETPVGEGAQPTAGAAQPGPTAEFVADEESTAMEEGIWTYQSDAIDVYIERKTQGAFTYYTADIQLTSPQQFSYAFSNEKYGAGTEALSDIAARHSPVVAINGDYYNFHSNGIIIRGGELYRAQNSSRQLLIVTRDGDLEVLVDRREKQGVVANQLVAKETLHTFEFGPVLVQNGKPVKNLTSGIVRAGEGYDEPRTAIGQLGPLHYLVIIVDGRSEASAGCDLPTLRDLFAGYDVITAFNLDGGGSTTLWFDGEVINHPASGDERRVSDIVMFMP